MSLVSETIPDNHAKVRDVKLKVPSSSLDGTQDYRPPAMSEVDRHVKNVPVEEEGTFILHLILLLKRVKLSIWNDRVKSPRDSSTSTCPRETKEQESHPIRTQIITNRPIRAQFRNE